MEMIQQYLDSIQNIGGVHICKVGENVTMEMVSEIGTAWRNRYGTGKPIIFIPAESMDFEYAHEFDVSIAIMMMKSGHAVTRRCGSDAYLKMEFGAVVGRTYDDETWRPYRLTDGDLHAQDWHVIKEN